MSDLNSKYSRYNKKEVKKNKNLFSFVQKIPFYNSIKEILSNKEIVTKVLFTLGLILVYRLLAVIPLPGVDIAVFREYFGSISASEASYLLLVFTGGQLDSPSIVGLGLSAYINASIIMQLLTPVIPKLTELSKEGERGTQMINRITRYLTLPLSFVYSIAYILLISKRDLNDTSGSNLITDNPKFLIPHAPGSDWPSISKVIFMALILAAGTILLMWISEIITEKGITNGSSVIISIGILASLPSLLSKDISQFNLNPVFQEILKGNFYAFLSTDLIIAVSLILGFILVLVAIVFINESTRKLDINYARRLQTGESKKTSNLPIKLTISGVMPIIFASALLAVPQLILPFVRNSLDTASETYKFIVNLENTNFLFATAASQPQIDMNDWIYAAVDFALIIAFGMFYAFIVMKPDETAENLQKSGAFVPGIRPGKSTQEFISRVLRRVAFAGSIYLAFIALVPIVARSLIVLNSNINVFILSGIGGTSVLITVSVIMDMIRTFNSLKATKSYEKYI